MKVEFSFGREAMYYRREGRTFLRSAGLAFFLEEPDCDDVSDEDPTAANSFRRRFKFKLSAEHNVCLRPFV